MAQLVESHVSNPAGRLRSALDRLERLAVRPDAATVEELLVGLDETEAEFERLEAEGVDLRPERVRWGNLTERLRARPQLVARAAATRAGGLEALRRAHPPATGFWWRADAERARRVRRAWVEIVGILAAIALLLVGGYAAFTYFFPPDPAAVALVQATSQIETALAAEDWMAARGAAETAFAAWPQEPEMAVWAGILAEREGDGEQADAAYAAARDALNGDEVRFWLLQSEVRQRIGDV
jgi:hypothetical protein